MCAQFRTDSGVIVRLMRNGRCRANIGHHNYRVFGTEGYMERIERSGKPVIRYNSTREEYPQALLETGGEFMPPAYADNPRATGHGGMDYALLDHFFDALLTGAPAPISLREGLRMTLPGIYAEASAKRNGQVDIVVGLEVEEEELIVRLINRGKTSGRSDDNLETIKKRLDVYNSQTNVLRDHYMAQGKYEAVHGMGSIEDIFATIKTLVEKHRR